MIEAQRYRAADTLRDGTPVTVRSIGRHDKSDLVAAFDKLDRQSVYTRFFTYKRQLTETELRELTEVDINRVVALVVTTPIAAIETLIGGGRYYCDASFKNAELAFTTADGYHGRGIASLVLQHLVSIGRENGISAFEADVLSENKAMIAVLSGSGLPMRRRTDGNVSHVELSLA